MTSLQPLKYFVCKPRSKTPTDKHAFASRMAMETYARVIQETDEEFAGQIMARVDHEKELVHWMGTKDGCDSRF
ncbi:MAG TPA: hypothetical protein ENI07_13055 [Desulfobacterales bacterium]|nr:hypothetical protein [Desulfobacterales bacterium]